MQDAERPGAPELTNPRAERVRQVARLSGRSVRSRTGRFLAEGPQAVREAVRAARAGAEGEHAPVPTAVEVVYATPAAMAALPDVLADAAAVGTDVRSVSEEVLAVMADTVTPQGVLAVVHLVDVGLEQVLAAGPRTLAVCVEVRDPGNAGTVIRAADAAGADAVVLTAGSVDVHSPKVVRASVGSLFHVPVVTGVALRDLVGACRDAGVGLLATSAAGSLDLDDLLDRTASGQGPLLGPHAWLFGNEAHGLSDEAVGLSDDTVSIPIAGAAESLNLAMAATLCLYASARARRT